MSRQNLQRHPSAVFTSDEDDGDQNNDTNLIDIQFSTPEGKSQAQPSQQTTTTTTSTVTTNQLQGIVRPLSTLTPSPSGQQAKKKQATRITTNDEIEIIDYVPGKKISQFIIQSNYIPRTLLLYNQRRLSVLPTFPSVIFNDNPQLLLTNVPVMELSAEQLGRRQHGTYKCPVKITNPNPATPSLLIQYYNKMFGSILERFKVDLSILDHNYARLKDFIQLFRSARCRLLPANKCAEDLEDLNEPEFPQLFEFYLQMDVDLFYMKTCSFRGAQPRSTTEGIFCLNIPECHYTMSKCGSCTLCTTPIDIQYGHRPPVLFNHYEKHRFVNKYESILNCPADCNTKNYIYVLTCACNEFDFISESKFRLDERLNSHCQLANNAIRKFLVGQGNIQNNNQYNQQQFGQSSNKNNMLLYQHTMQCSKAIQMFLDKNPSYWPFVPLPIDQATQDNLNLRIMRVTTGGGPTTTTNYVTEDRTIQNNLAQVPKPPPGYKFSKRQIEKQIDFFKKNLLTERFNDEVYIYSASIIAVMPPNTTDLFRRIIHSLFVTHTETKLNALGHIFSNSENINIRNGVWCANLKQHQIFLS